MRMRGHAVTMLLALFLLVSCKPKTEEIDIKSNVEDKGTGTIEIFLRANRMAKLELEGLPAGSFTTNDENRHIRIDVTKLPAGPQKLIVKASGTDEGKVRLTGRTEVAFTPKPLPPTLSVRPVGTAGGGHHDLYVNSDSPTFSGKVRLEELNLAVSHSTGKGKLNLSAPKGTKVVFASQTWTSPGDAAWDLELDLRPMLWAASPDWALKGNGSLKVPVSVTSPAGATVSYNLLLQASNFMSDFLKKLPLDKPLLAPGEKADEPAVAALVLPELVPVGEAKRMDDYDLIAVTRVAATRTKRCGTYRGSRTGKARVISNAAEDVEMTVHDRRLGKVVGKRRFRAPMPSCPSSLESDYSGVKITGDREAQETFLRSLLGPKR